MTEEVKSMICENFKGESYLGEGISWCYGESCTNEAKFLVAWEVEWAGRESDYFEANVCEECKQVLVQRIEEKKFKLLKVEALHKHEICNECGRSVAFGSGRYVNRVPDLNDEETRQEGGKPFPQGDFICAECDIKARCLNPKKKQRRS